MGKRKKKEKLKKGAQKPKYQIPTAEKLQPEDQDVHNSNTKNDKTKKIKDFRLHKVLPVIVIPLIIGVLSQYVPFILEDKREENKPSSFSAIMNLHAYSIGIVEDENIPLYYSNDEYCTLMEISATNQNDVTVNIKDIIVEVTDYKSLDEFTIKGPVGGANERDVLFWSCDISPEKGEYYSQYNGTDENSAEDISRTKYVEMQPDDSGEFVVKIYPDTPGLYEVKAIIEYTYKDMIERKETKCGKFVFDPKHEGNYKAILSI